MATKMTETNRKVPSTLNLERQKRLLPYINYYLSNNRPKPEREQFTPFLESNAIPGPFIPIVKNVPKNIEVEYVPQPPLTEKNPNYAVIYDTLAELKQAQQNMRHSLSPVYRKPITYYPMHYYDQYRDVQPAKTIIETYTPTNIDIPDNSDDKKYGHVTDLVYKMHGHKPQVSESYVIERPLVSYRIPEEAPKSYFGDKLIVRKPLVMYEEKQPEYTQNEKPIVYEVPTTRPQANTIVDDKYVAQKFTPVSRTEEQEHIYQKQYTPVQFVTEQPKYVHYYSSPAPVVPTENTNILSKILKQLQNSNTLPQTLTAENIDNSIRTLVKILNGLRKQQRLKTKPIVVVEESSEETPEKSTQEGENVLEKPDYEYVPGTITQTFPANTIEGGTPGRPGIDYPALSSIPQTSFNCKTQRYKGFFGDPHTNCQVWHYCDLNGGQASFLCPNGTIFSQVALTCDWWYNVKCSSTAQLYVLNERLYKYILPLAPKFPEDYSGPLVDRYLALKFKEMEEKMKNEKKKDDKSEEEKDDSDQLQDIRNEKAKSSEET
ncbi:uncharacterized protein [Tenebrio molitor]